MQLQKPARNYNSTILIILLGVLMILGMRTAHDVLTAPYVDEQPTTTAPGSPVIMLNAVLQFPTATATLPPTPTNTPKPSTLDKYGSCDGRKGGSVCVKPTGTPPPGLAPLIDGTPTRLPICDVVEENVLCIQPTPKGMTESEVETE